MNQRTCRKYFPLGSLGFVFTVFSLWAAVTLSHAETPASLSPPMKPIAAPTAQAVSIAAAANLVYVLDEVNAAFRAREPHAILTVAIGASGSLVAQVQQGAPFDVFLSADLEHPQALISSGAADAKTLRIFATGQLVLWTIRPGIQLSSLEETVRNKTIRRIAIANTDTAPYGRAAKQALEAIGAWRDIERKLVYGENITQTAQFVETGNADVGLVALSLVLSPKLKDRGRWIPVPENAYTPLAQSAVLTSKGAKNVMAARYLQFFRSPEAEKIFERYGYRAPGREPR